MNQKTLTKLEYYKITALLENRLLPCAENSFAAS